MTIAVAAPSNHKCFIPIPCAVVLCSVVFLQHGLLDSPVAWVSSGRLASLAFRSYQAGYDVFLGIVFDAVRYQEWCMDGLVLPQERTVGQATTRFPTSHNRSRLLSVVFTHI